MKTKITKTKGPDVRLSISFEFDSKKLPQDEQQKIWRAVAEFAKAILTPAEQQELLAKFDEARRRLIKHGKPKKTV